MKGSMTQNPKKRLSYNDNSPLRRLLSAASTLDHRPVRRTDINIRQRRLLVKRWLSRFANLDPGRRRRCIRWEKGPYDYSQRHSGAIVLCRSLAVGEPCYQMMLRIFPACVRLIFTFDLSLRVATNPPSPSPSNCSIESFAIIEERCTRMKREGSNLSSRAFKLKLQRCMPSLVCSCV